MNNSGIEPTGHRLLVLPDQIEEVSEGGIILHTATLKEREQMAQTDGIVVAIGPTAYSDQPAAWCKVGDKVIFAKYAGLLRTGSDGKEYRLINDLDVAGIFK